MRQSHDLPFMDLLDVDGAANVMDRLYDSGPSNPIDVEAPIGARTAPPLHVAAVVLPATADEVVALTKVNFQKEAVQDHSGLVEFYAPWFAPSPFLTPAPAATTLLQVPSSVVVSVHVSFPLSPQTM